MGGCCLSGSYGEVQLRRSSFSTSLVSEIEVRGLAEDPPSAPTVRLPLETEELGQSPGGVFLGLSS